MQNIFVHSWLSLSEEIKVFLIEKGQPIRSFEDASWVI
jgi:hypothetical protein